MFICEIGIIILIMLEISVDWAGSTKSWFAFVFGTASFFSVVQLKLL